MHIFKAEVLTLLNIMAIQQFYLLGEPATATTAIETDSSLDFDGLKQLIASYFAIVEPNGECTSKIKPVQYRQLLIIK